MINNIFFNEERLSSLRRRAEQDDHVRTLIDSLLEEME